MAIRGNRRRPRRESLAEPPAEAFRPDAVRQAVRRRALRQPSTWVAGALAVGSLAAVPFLGPIALGATALAGIGGLAAWSRRAFGGAAAAAELAHIKELEAQRQRARLDQLDHLADDFAYHGVPRGGSQCRELGAAWKTLAGAVGERHDVVALDISRLGDDALVEGIRLLSAARDACAALEAIDHRPLERDLEAAQRERGRLAEQAASADRLLAVDERIATLERRLAMVEEQRGAIEHLFSDVEHLESALHEAYLGLVGQGTQSALDEPSSRASELAQAVDVARRVALRVGDLELGADEVHRP